MGEVPRPAGATDLARPAEALPVLAATAPFRCGKGQQLLAVDVLSVGVRLYGGRVRTPWTVVPSDRSGSLNCLCTSLQRWATSLRRAGQAATVVTVLPALPRGTSSVDIVLPGLPALRRVPVTAAAAGAFRVAGTERVPQRTWGGTPYGAPPGWLASRWPTPVPAPALGRAYEERFGELRS